MSKSEWKETRHDELSSATVTVLDDPKGDLLIVIRGSRAARVAVKRTRKRARGGHGQG